MAAIEIRLSEIEDALSSLQIKTAPYSVAQAEPMTAMPRLERVPLSPGVSPFRERLENLLNRLDRVLGEIRVRSDRME